MDRKKKVMVKHDKLSSLPDELIHHIFSFAGDRSYQITFTVLMLTLSLLSSKWKSVSTLRICAGAYGNNLPFSDFVRPSWDLPCLTTLILESVAFNKSGECGSVDPFFKFVNLKELYLCNCRTSGINDVLNIVAYRLETLIIFYDKYQAKPCKFKVSAPKLSSFECTCQSPIKLSTAELPSLKKVKLSIRQGLIWTDGTKHDDLLVVFDMFDQLCSASTLELDSHIVYGLSRRLYPFKNAPYKNLAAPPPSPFRMLQHLHLGYFRDDVKAGVIEYFIKSSPSAKVHLDQVPEYPWKVDNRDDKFSFVKEWEYI